MKNTLRQAPDVILVGEVRDREAMEYALSYAETGHLCLTTLHANSTNQAIDRIINFFPEERRPQLLMDLSLNLKAIVSQRLTRRRDGKGRFPAVEVMINTPMMADLILKGDISGMKELMAKSNQLGMCTFDQALFQMIDAGIISVQEGMRNADSINDLRLQLKLGSRNSKSSDFFKGTEELSIEAISDEAAL
jgi:twitching motility protein PilU